GSGNLAENPWFVGIFGWIVPGGGHLLQRRMLRGGLVLGIFWSMFIVAVFSGGAHYPGFGFADGPLLYLLNVFGRLGSGLGALISWIVGSMPAKDIAALATFEYGGRFLEVAGLINYLAAIDAVDIAVGRKR
nr:hypothetical protein [Blastocatellia bacterium]